MAVPNRPSWCGGPSHLGPPDLLRPAAEGVAPQRLEQQAGHVPRGRLRHQGVLPLAGQGLAAGVRQTPCDIGWQAPPPLLAPARP